MRLLKRKRKLKEIPRVRKNHLRRLKSLLPLKREQEKIEIFEFSLVFIMPHLYEANFCQEIYHK
jgi:hypothetical protein